MQSKVMFEDTYEIDVVKRNHISWRKQDNLTFCQRAHCTKEQMLSVSTQREWTLMVDVGKAADV